jgi:hypothetical protein
MTGQPPLDGRDESMELSDGALKERFETALSGMSPDAQELLEGGMQLGVQLRRRRRAELLGAAGLSVAAAATLVYSNITADWFDSNSTGPADTPSSLVQVINQPATARSLAAAALEHLRPDQVIGAGSMGSSSPRSSVFASVAVSTDQGKAQLDLLATRRVMQWDRRPACAPNTSLDVVYCRVSRLDDGTQLVLMAEKAKGTRGSPRYLVSLGARRDTEVVAVLEYLVDNRATPADDSQPVADWSLPVSVATMRAIVTDPQFGVMASPRMIAEGEALDNFRGSMVTHTHAGAVHVATVAPPVPTGPQIRPQRPSTGSASASASTQSPGESAASSGP